MSDQFNIDEMKAKIAKLLAKAEGTTNEAERDAFAAKAETLMLKLGIARAELESVGQAAPERVVEVRREWKGNYSMVWVPVTHRIALSLGHITVLQRNVSAVLRYTYLIGHESDVQRLEQLLDSVFIQATAALHRWQRGHREERRWQTDMEKFVGNRSFLEGFGQAVSYRLSRERAVEEEQATQGAELVLANKQSRVDSWVAQQYPKLGKARGGFSTDWRATAAGSAAGENADLGHTRTGGSKEAIHA